MGAALYSTRDLRGYSALLVPNLTLGHVARCLCQPLVERPNTTPSILGLSLDRRLIATISRDSALGLRRP